ncbi:glycosyl transferase [Nonlabens sp.]|uniref:glycosyl transferase n=1 Tax=Nonlabens sp. TaxID=1888209 RepID=UPI001BCAF5D8|nr:glycosyl transferase [Nonlabens sp.]
MKLKEWPSSLYNSWRLNKVKGEELIDRNVPEIDAIVSLTSIPSRLETIHITLKSVLLQDCKPKKIVLWLHKDLEGHLPETLTSLTQSLLEIRYSDYTFSHRKLIHSVKAFPQDMIITVDDDVIYHPSTLSKLYEAAIKNPSKVTSHRGRNISFDKEGKVLPYPQWKYATKETADDNWFMPIGAFTVAYPPNVLSNQVTDLETFMRITPKNDDPWFKVMALLNGNNSVPSGYDLPEPIPISGTQKISLKKINVDRDYNRTQMENILNEFPELRKLINTSAQQP